MSNTELYHIPEKPLTVVGAAWCGYSQKQFKSLGCSNPDGDFSAENTSYQAKRADGTSVDFIWCQDDKGETVVANQDHPACKVETSGYPSWVQGTESEGFEPSEVQGYVPPCQMKEGILDQSVLGCDAMKAAGEFCQEQEKEAHDDDKVKGIVSEMETLKGQMESKKTELEAAVQPFQEACKQKMEEANPFAL